MNLGEILGLALLFSLPLGIVLFGQQIGFTPISPKEKLIYTKELYPLLNESITDSKSLILISMPWFRFRKHKTEEDYQIMSLIELLKQKSEQGVKVRVILETDKVNCATLFNLEDSGAIVRVLPNLHAKFLVIDNQKAFVISHNFVPQSFGPNKEVGVYTIDENTVKELASYFTKLWKEAYEEPTFCD